MDGLRVHERDLEPEEAWARALVDQIRACPGELRERGGEVAHLVRNVVHAGTALDEKPPDRSVLAERLEQLDAAVADPDGSGPDALLLHGRAMLELGAEQPAVGVQRDVEILDGDTEMMDTPRRHRSDASGRAWRRSTGTVMPLSVTEIEPRSVFRFAAFGIFHMQLALGLRKRWPTAVVETTMNFPRVLSAFEPILAVHTTRPDPSAAPVSPWAIPSSTRRLFPARTVFAASKFVTIRRTDSTSRYDQKVDAPAGASSCATVSEPLKRMPRT